MKADCICQTAPRGSVVFCSHVKGSLPYAAPVWPQCPQPCCNEPIYPRRRRWLTSWASRPKRGRAGQ